MLGVLHGQTADGVLDVLATASGNQLREFYESLKSKVQKVLFSEISL